MSLAVRTARSAVWMTVGGYAARIVSTIGTLVIVHYVSPDEYGEALVAIIAVLTASQLSQLGISQYVTVKAHRRPDLAFHATVFQLALGLVAMALVALFYQPLGAWVNAPSIGRYVPIMLGAVLIDRVSLVPERMLMCELRFRNLSLARTSGELAYTAVSLVTAMRGWGGMSVAFGNLARSAVRALLIVPFVARRTWWAPCRLRREVIREVLVFGLPLTIGAFAAFITVKWDNLLVSRFFGPAVMGAYNVAYNLAGLSSGLVTDQIVDILVPSFAGNPERRRPDTLLRGMSLLALITMPLSLGLGVIAPTVVTTVFAHAWSQVASMLSILCLVAALGPMVGLCISYLQAGGRTAVVMTLQIIAAVGILGSIGCFGRLGPLWTCSAVGLGGLVCASATVYTMQILEGIPARRVIATQLGPLLACAPMVGAVLGVRRLLAHAGLHVRGLPLAIELAVGAIVYVPAALVLARAAALDLIGLLRAALTRGSRRRSGEAS